jgi:bacteriophage N4 adsorption protein B
VESLFLSLAASADAIVAALLVPLACWIVLNGADDIAIDLLGLYAAKRRRANLTRDQQAADATSPKRIAIIVPCWHEDAVIGRMVQQNIDSIRYSAYDFFIGVYPNDEATAGVVRHLEARYANVHSAMSPHNGPTSKADCLNSVWQAILQYEKDHGVRFEVLVTHDAEDVIHPAALQWINYYADTHGMIQVPVLPLATPFLWWTHAVYCDEFAEYQSRDMPARDAMNAFIPSNGVGTGFRRDAVEQLARDEGHVFQPGSLTEDYENGYRLRLAGVKQIFLPLHKTGIATREYFPWRFDVAVRQRTRWVTGITLQTWDRHGWDGPGVIRYWLWRDRKGLLNNPAGAVANLLSAYMTLTWAVSVCSGGRWQFAGALDQHYMLLSCTAIVSMHRILYRVLCVSHVYGWLFAMGVPFRMIYANVVNSAAVLRAVQQFTIAKLRGKSLAWAKTTHEYPAQVAFGQPGLRIGELLVLKGRITTEQLTEALATKPAGVRIGEHLVRQGLAEEHDVYHALSTQHGLPGARLDASKIPRAVARALPAMVARDCRVVPFRVEFASLFLAAPEIPTAEVRKKLQRYTMLDLRFHLVTPTEFEELVQALL